MSMKRATKHWLQGVAAGICIGLGTITYLLISNKLLGAFVFAFGLFLVCGYRLKLCTGMAGYLINKSVDTSGFVLAAVGNVNGMTLMYVLSILWKPELKLISTQILESKTAMMPYQTFISALFCGMLMFIAVDGYKNASDTLFRIISIFVAVPIFVLNGFDHCIVSMYYLHGATTFELFVKGHMFFSVTMIGNFIGALVANLLLQRLFCWNVTKRNK